MSDSGGSPKTENDWKMDNGDTMDKDDALKAERSDDAEVQKADGQAAESSKAPEEDYEPISYFSLYRYADRWDVLFIILGTTGALVNGAGLPVFAIFLGEIMTLGSTRPTSREGSL